NSVISSISEEKAFVVARIVADRWLQKVFDEAGPLFLDGKVELDLRREYITPTLAAICNHWFGIPDSLLLPNPARGNFVDPGGWSWEPAGARKPLCPGDYMATSRYCFYPDPVPRVQAYGREQGQALRKAVREYFDKFRPSGLSAELTKAVAELKDSNGKFVYPTNDELARTIIGIMTGFLPPADGSLRWTFYEWLEEKTLWRVQQDLQPGSPASAYARANLAVRPSLEQAMQKRPSPDLLWRTATRDHGLGGVDVRTDDKVVIGIVSALAEDAAANVTDVYPIFGGDRGAPGAPLHACPAHKAAMGTMLGIISALLERCRIEALPAPLLVKLTDLMPKAPPPPATPSPPTPPSS
ncbi:MAG: hypothetical protein ABWX67_02575, partial [Allosphingosinicella sp.]